MISRKRQVHLDFHTSEYILGVGDQFKQEDFVEKLKEASINSVTCFGRCHHGWLYYPSKLQPEMVHPNLKNKRLLLDQIACCHQEDILVPVYTTVQWDGYVAKNHPEWLCVDEFGEKINSQDVSEPHFYYSLCLNSGYRDYFKAHLLDLIEVVGVKNLDGIFMDILFQVSCNCTHCQKEMEALGINTKSTRNRLEYSSIMLAAFKEEITQLIRKQAPEASIFYNGSHVGFSDKASINSYSHLELESLPSGGWGYDHFPITMRYARNLEKEVIGMTGKFHTYWGDFHSLKNLPALEFECFNMLALGAGCSIGDQLHPDGRLSAGGYELIGSVYRQVEAVEEKCKDMSVPEVEIGVLTPEETWKAGGQSLRIDPSIIGANRLLQELNYQFDIIDSEMDFKKYKVIVLPDNIKYHEKLVTKLEAFISQGGGVVGSYCSLLDDEAGGAFYGIEYLGDREYDRDFILPNDQIGRELPKEEFVMYLKGSNVRVVEGAVVLRGVAPYFNREGDRFCSHQHAPSKRRGNFVAASQLSTVYYFSHPLFRLYRKNGANWVKVILKDVLAELIPDKLLKHNGPSTLLTTVNRSLDKKRHLVHGLHYIAQKKSEDIYIIDEVIPLHEIKISYFVGKQKVEKVTDVITSEELEFSINAGYVTFGLEKIVGHTMIEVVTEE